MNNNTNTTAPGTRENGAQPRGFRPRLSFYHANAKGSGSAVRFEAVPASGDRDGSVFLTLAQQKSVATGSAEQGNRQYATFDWQNRVTVKLNFGDLCQMLLVLKGQNTAIADGKGLYHDSRNTTTLINLTRQAEPYPGCVLDVSRRNKGGAESPPVRTRILFNGTEAYGLGVVLEQTLGLLAFGIPRDFQSGPAPVSPDMPAAEDETF